MKLRALRQDHTIVALAAILFGSGLAAVNALWPKAFVVTIAIGGVLGAFMVLYEVRMTKRLAQAEFIRDLQTTFGENANIQTVWSKLLLKQEVTHADRPAVSSYLTFFETLHLLVARGTLDLGLADDLFRNRFFKAVGDSGILRTALASEMGSFANIHNLINAWHAHLVARRIPVHAGYYEYVRGMAEAKGYEIRELTTQDLPELLSLQTEVLQALGNRHWLRANEDSMLKECLAEPRHQVLGATLAGRLLGAAVLFDGLDTSENIRRYFSADPAALDAAINLKLVLVAPDARGEGLGRALVELLEQAAVTRGKAEILCTIHRQNRPSRRLFEVLHYRRFRSIDTAYGRRDVYVRSLPQVAQQWAR